MKMKIVMIEYRKHDFNINKAIDVQINGLYLQNTIFYMHLS